jgi:hypothetical protein
LLAYADNPVVTYIDMLKTRLPKMSNLAATR